MILSFDIITNLKLIFEFKRKVWEILRVTEKVLAKCGLRMTSASTDNCTKQKTFRGTKLLKICGTKSFFAT